MSVLFLNRHEQALGLDEFRSFAQRLLRQLGQADGLSVVLLSDEEMVEYNRKYLARDCSTDVLAFPDSPLAVEWEAYLGDILISVDTARRQAKRLGHPLSHEIKALIIHGLLHLLGYDHAKDDGEMARLEQRLREELIGNQSLATLSADSILPD